jgi:hypothetical protein
MIVKMFGHANLPKLQQSCASRLGKEKNRLQWNFDSFIIDFTGFVHRVADSFFLGKFPIRDAFPIQLRKNPMDQVSSMRVQSGTPTCFSGKPVNFSTA